MWMDVSPCSLNILFSSLAIDSHTAEFCLLLIGWWSFHVAKRKRISVSSQLGEWPLVLASLLEFSTLGPSLTPLALALWYGLICDLACESNCQSLACGSHSWFWKAGKIYGPLVGRGSAKWLLTGGIMKGRDVLKCMTIITRYTCW